MLSAMIAERNAVRERDAIIEEAIDVLVEYGLELYRKMKERKKKPWTRKWIRRRNALGGGLLLRELREEDPRSFQNIMRMDTERFDELLHMIENTIQRADTEMRAAIPARLKLEVTLRFLATGDSFKSLSYFFRLPPSSISVAIPEVLRAIIFALSSYMKVSIYACGVYFIAHVPCNNPMDLIFHFSARRQKMNGRLLLISLL